MKIAVFDVGGTFIKYALSDENGNFSKKGKKPTPAKSHEDFFVVIQEILDELKEVEGMAFSLPGFIDPENGYIAVGGALRYHDDYAFVSEMEKRFKLPITIQNDAKCAALAEVWQGNAKDCKNAVVLVFGTGVGGAFIQEGKVYIGSHFMASELSFVLNGDIEKFSYRSLLGGRLSIPMLVKKVSERMGKEMNGEEVFALYEKKDPIACEELEQYFKNAAVDIFNIHCFYDPDIFLIGGGVSENPLFVEGIQKAVDTLLTKLPFDLPAIKLATTKSKSDANLIGALYQYLTTNK